MPRLVVAIALAWGLAAGACATAAPARNPPEAAEEAPPDIRSPTEAEYKRLQALDEAQSAARSAAEWGRVEAAMREMLGIATPTFGPDHLTTGWVLTTLGIALSEQGRNAEAEEVLRSAIRIQRAKLGERHQDLASNYDRLANLLVYRTELTEAESLYRRALEIKLATLGPQHARTAVSIQNLASLLSELGRHAEAEREFRRAVKIFERAAGRRSVDAANAYSGLAGVLDQQGRFKEAEDIYRAALDTYRRELGDQHPDVGQAHTGLAITLLHQGRPADAERHARQAVAILLASGRSDGSEAAGAYEVLAATLSSQRRYADAELLDRRVLEMRLRLFGARSPATGASYGNLAVDLARQGRPEEALPMARKSLEVSLAVFGERSHRAALAYNSVAVDLQALGRFAEGADMKRKALEIIRAQLGERHPDTAKLTFSLAWTLNRTGEYAQAESLLRAALETQRTLLGDFHPDTASTYGELAMSLLGQGRALEGLETAERGVTISQGRLRQSLRDGGGRDVGRREDNANKPLDALLGVAAALAETRTPAPDGLPSRAFEVAQDLHQSAAGQALAQSALRSVAARVGAEAEVRAMQQAAAEARTLDEKFLKLLATGDMAGAASVRKNLEANEASLGRLERRIQKRFPRYAELVSPAALGVEQAQARLQPGEGLLLVMSSGRDLHVFGLSRQRLEWRRLRGASPDIEASVRALRCDADPSTCPGRRAPEAEGDEAFPPFDRRRAFELYRRLIQPVEGALAGVTTLHVVTGGALSGLPLGLLVVEDPGPAGQPGAAEFAATRWLADRYALVTLPSVSALRALAAARPSAGRQPLLGYGDPVLAGYDTPRPDIARGAGRPAYLRASAPGQPTLADPDMLRRSLASLPGTRAELAALAAALGAPASALHMGPAATEASIKSLPDLSEARVVVIATHGLLPREVRGLDEPGLVFTPPKTPSVEDDGILTASEVARLRLGADWVILSACNTAASDGAPGAESLSGLAKGFIFAGARALLVSHWQVDDQVTAALTVQTLFLSRAAPARSNAQALRDAMRAVRTGRLPDGRPMPNWEPFWAHPGAWAPFVLVSTEP